MVAPGPHLTKLRPCPSTVSCTIPHASFEVYHISLGSTWSLLLGFTLILTFFRFFSFFRLLYFYVH